MPPTFADLGVPAEITASLHARGIDRPFDIQRATIPDLLAGRDLCGKAPTGSGKTLAFGIPLVTRVGRARPRRPRGLVLVPTRELAAQVEGELTMLGRPLGRSVVAAYGGVGFGPQLKALHRGVDIVVACPGRLTDLIGRGDTDLRDVEVVVLDEADRMADMGFLPEVRRLLDATPPKRQTVLFSATLDGDVDALVRDHQRHPTHHEVLADEANAGDVDHVFWEVPGTDRVRVAASVVERHGRTIVFCRTRRGADRVARQLATWGVDAEAIHGDRTQSQRERALSSFHRGRISALVATDVAARGIHVDGVRAVVHFDPPADHKDYRHRSGRTGRAGDHGIVISLVVDKVKGHVRNLQRDLDLPAGFASPDLGDHEENTHPPGAIGTVPTRSTLLVH